LAIHQQGEVLGDEVIAQRPLLLRAAGKFAEGALSACAHLLDGMAIGQQQGQQIGDAPVGRLRGADPLDEAREPGPGVRIVQRLLRDLRESGESVLERRGDERFAGGEPPVQGGDADAGLAGDVLQRDVRALRAECCPRGLQNAPAVAPAHPYRRYPSR
jgi:hypothetical protein